MYIYNFVYIVPQDCALVTKARGLYFHAKGKMFNLPMKNGEKKTFSPLKYFFSYVIMNLANAIEDTI